MRLDSGLYCHDKKVSQFDRDSGQDSPSDDAYWKPGKVPPLYDVIQHAHATLTKCSHRMHTTFI